jgi:hypothetical protein
VPDIAPIEAAGRANGNEFNATRLDLDVRSAAPEESPVKAMRFDFAGEPVSRQGADIVGRRSLSRSLSHRHQSAGGICVTKASKERKEIIRVNPCCYLARVPAMVFQDTHDLQEMKLTRSCSQVDGAFESTRL